LSVNIQDFKEIDPAERLLLGAGPCNMPPRVFRAVAAPSVGYLDPYLFRVMDETQELLRALFRTENTVTLPMSATGGGGMETVFVNLLEPGDQVLIGVNGLFGTRMCDIAERLGCDVVRVDVEWGRAVPAERMEAALKGKSPKVVAVVNAETSTGACTPLKDLAKLAHDHGALFLADTVTSLAGIDVSLDADGVDVAYSGTQKCISAFPGMSLVSFGPAAMKLIEARTSKVPNWYLDMTMIRDYWGPARKYHHTPAINMIYGLREALRIVHEEGLEARFARHMLNHRALVAGLEAMGLTMLVPKAERLPMLNAVRIPEGTDEAKVRAALLRDFSIEISGGLGELAGKVWRIGLMGYNAQPRNVLLFLAALEAVLRGQGVKVGAGAIEAAAAVWAV
jgi:alanine-glyoxylate transaminase/serine-glyoxylate transaminase/serine-pyruvate transaminase